MRAASDLHLAPHTASWVFQALADLRADADAYGGPTVLVGDVFDQAETVSIPLLNRLRDVLRDFPDRVIIVPGNHDQYDGWRNACEALEGGPVEVMSTPQLVSGIGLCVPYCNPADWPEIVASFTSWKDPALPPLIFAHQGFKGSYLNSMVRDRAGIRVTGLNGRVVITGHYHMPQNVAQVIYCGSPYQTSHAETGQEKGFLAWPTATRTTWRDWIPERRPYVRVTAPRYWTVPWDGTGEPKPPPTYREGDIVRIVTSLTRDALDGASAKAIKKAGLAGASIMTAPSPQTRVDLRATTSLSDAIGAWVDEVRKDGVDRHDLTDFLVSEGLWPGAE